MQWNLQPGTNRDIYVAPISGISRLSLLLVTLFI